MIYKSQQMKFHDISIGGYWFYRCRDKGTRTLNNPVKVTSLWKIWKRIYWSELCLNLPPKGWESLETPLPYRLRARLDTIPVMPDWPANKRVHFSSQYFVEETGVRFWGGCTDLPDGRGAFQGEHGGEVKFSEAQCCPHWFKKPH